MKNLPLGIRKWRFFFTYFTVCVPLFTLFYSVAPSIQNLTVYGKITDISGMPLAGVHVMSVYTKKGVVTDFDGAYQIEVNSGDSLRITAIGYKSQTKVVNDKKQINIALIEDITQLGTVMINAGYYDVTERERTGNISRITSKDIEKQPVNNPLAAMQGYMSGVNIVQTTGVPGGSYDIEIRGKNFISGDTQPLFIVDGVPFASHSLEAYEVSANINSGNISPLNFINPSDIDSIEVLKDADATAIYGSRGANGVVLITTKKGNQGKARLNIGFNTGLASVTKFRDLMNTEQYLKLRNEAIENDNYSNYFNNPNFDYIWPDLKSWDQERYTDWQKVLIGGTAYRNNMQASLVGGNSQLKFLVSGSHLKETTVFPGDSNYKKSTIQNGLTYNSLNEKLSLNITSGYSFENNQLPYTDFTQLANTLEPNAPELFTDSGELNWENGTWNNPLANLERKYQVKSNTFYTNAVLSYNLFDKLEFKSSMGYNKYIVESSLIYPSSALNPTYGYGSDFSTSLSNQSQRNSWIIEPQLNWQNDFGNLSVSCLLGATIQESNEKQLVLSGRGFPNNNLIYTLSAASTLNILKDRFSEYKYMAYFGRLNFNYKSKYIINITGRRDGSSRFGSDNKFGNFGAVGLAWIFSDESLFKNSSWFSFGKIRGSYGTTGSDNIGDYQYLGTYELTGHDYNNVAVIEPSGVYNPNFGWEINKKFEVGLELGLFQNQITIQAVRYQNKSSNQLIGLPLAGTTGFNSLTTNFNATVENLGYEFDIQTKNINGDNFNWTSSINLTIPKNKLLEFRDIENSTFSNKYVVGKPLSIIHLYESQGVDPQSGLYQFTDFNNDGKITSLDDKGVIMDLTPEFYGGLKNTFSYKNVSLDFLFQFKKQKGKNNISTDAMVGAKRNGHVGLYNRWQNPGDVSPFQRASIGAYPGVTQASARQRQSDLSVSDASFIRLRNVTLNYSLPFHNAPGLDMNLFLQGQNLLTITNYDGADPEQTSNYILPPLRQITLGLQANF
ncbi:SusC/RagA family TonB-linked outer membrane protein [Aestuariibaculum sp. M13]|uniref:SusC/RagA family TonB-linked outer membrane protein n=1 Tax=Aestuariibaculum sp. M13 TaxID=2967132 RepID=UPI002159EE16|nr:SusC/RagA family TonB-linked outer membrane protein [Aestuariibaculum sp. M13]MCR8668240.1 SusC/RagA family TonB-linked outer membrane protein [Aestuariibaculum sp. M13]